LAKAKSAAEALEKELLELTKANEKLKQGLSCRLLMGVFLLIILFLDNKVLEEERLAQSKMLEASMTKSRFDTEKENLRIKELESKVSNLRSEVIPQIVLCDCR